MATQLGSSQWTSTSPSSNAFQRPLGDSEFAFFPSSSTGLGDMFLHIALRAPPNIMRRERVRIAWSVIRITHPLLMSEICVDGEDVTTARFSFTPPTGVQDVLDKADNVLYYRSSSKEELIFDYMNGPRTLSNEHLSYLVVSGNHHDAVSVEGEYDLFMCAPHFTGDGTSLHQSTHDLLVLLTSSKSDAELQKDLEVQFEHATSSWADILPPAFETRLSTSSSPFARAVYKVNYLQTQRGEIGDHVLPRTQRGPRRTRLIEHAFSEEQTRVILSTCKKNGVSVNNALIALCNVVWARMTRSAGDDGKLPMMMYTAINLRPYLSPLPLSPSTYWFLALTYFNVVLPSFPPSSAAVFWHRARLAKIQTAKTVKSHFLVARALEMAGQRAERARGSTIKTTTANSKRLPELPPHARSATPTPSRALLGLSLIGNLDLIYKTSCYTCSGVHLHSVTTASRQKEGGLLLLEHTFAGKLWLCLCWDESGFREGVVEELWESVTEGVNEFLCL